MYILNFIHSYKVKTDNKYMIFCSICDKRKTKTNSDKFGLCNKCSLPVCGDTNCGSDLRAFSPSGTVVHECMSCILNKMENLTEESSLFIFFFALSISVFRLLSASTKSS